MPDKSRLLPDGVVHVASRGWASGLHVASEAVCGREVAVVDECPFSTCENLSEPRMLPDDQVLESAVVDQGATVLSALQNQIAKAEPDPRRPAHREIAMRAADYGVQEYRRPSCGERGAYSSCLIYPAV